MEAIDGFSAVVAREYAERLDDSGREMLERVRNGVAKLNMLIDAMLVLSRRSRQDLRLRRVDLSELARAVVSGLREHDPQRRVEVVVADGLSAVGDRELLRIVLEQLLGNAWKFTAGRDDARIEFSGETENGCQRYVVRDNGAGFDMAYADRLFVPFQRLHRDAEFSGLEQDSPSRSASSVATEATFAARAASAPTPAFTSALTVPIRICHDPRPTQSRAQGRGASERRISPASLTEHRQGGRVDP